MPTRAEMLRIKGFLVVTRNATRDYVDYTALAQPLSGTDLQQALAPLDTLYALPGLRLREGAESSVLHELGLRLEAPRPQDLDGVQVADFRSPRGTAWAWSSVRTAAIHESVRRPWPYMTRCCARTTWTPRARRQACAPRPTPSLAPSDPRGVLPLRAQVPAVRLWSSRSRQVPRRTRLGVDVDVECAQGIEHEAVKPLLQRLDCLCIVGMVRNPLLHPGLQAVPMEKAFILHLADQHKTYTVTGQPVCRRPNRNIHAHAVYTSRCGAAPGGDLVRKSAAGAAFALDPVGWVEAARKG